MGSLEQAAKIRVLLVIPIRSSSQSSNSTTNRATHTASGSRSQPAAGLGDQRSKNRLEDHGEAGSGEDNSTAAIPAAPDVAGLAYTFLSLRATVSCVNPQGFGTDDGCAGRTGPGKGGEAAQTRAQATPPAAAAGAALAATWQRAGWPPGPPNSRYLSRLLCACSIFWPDNPC